MENLSLRHNKWKLAPENKSEFYQKRHEEEVLQELQRIETTLHWKKVSEKLFHAKILARHQVEDLILMKEARKHPDNILALESEKGLFVKKPNQHIKHYHQSFSRIKGKLLK